MRAIVASALSIAMWTSVALGGAPPESTPAGAPAVTSPPAWIRTPNGDDFARAYPPEAARRGIAGRVVMECDVETDGRLQCAVASEQPPGYGFGEAALKLQSRFLLRPAMRDGHPVIGGHISIPIWFRSR